MIKVLSGKEISNDMITKIHEGVLHDLEQFGRSPVLCVVTSGSDAGSQSYLKGIRKKSEQAGISFRLHHVSEESTEEEVTALIRKINDDPEIDGVLVMKPVGQNIDQEKLVAVLDPGKDVEGLTVQNQADLFLGKKTTLPCTAESVMCFFEHYNIPLEGKRAVVLGRSNRVGKPAAMLLMQKNATVTICHSRTKDMKEIVQQADVLVCAMGQAAMIDHSWLKDGMVVVDAGVGRKEDGTMSGDLDWQDIQEMEIQATPVPGGVGALTTAVLLRNVYRLYRRHYGLWSE